MASCCIRIKILIFSQGRVKRPSSDSCLTLQFHFATLYYSIATSSFLAFARAVSIPGKAVVWLFTCVIHDHPSGPT